MATLPDPHDLQRFVDAQAPVMAQVLAELDAGRKRSHWMWFVFPQLRGLGRSAMAERYGIASLAEAVAYQAHPVLGRRLIDCSQRVLAVLGRNALQIFGTPDDMKLQSSMTLFAAAAPEVSVYGQVLARYFGGRPDPRTLEMLR